MYGSEFVNGNNEYLNACCPSEAPGPSRDADLPPDDVRKRLHLLNFTDENKHEGNQCPVNWQPTPPWRLCLEAMAPERKLTGLQSPANRPRARLSGLPLPPLCQEDAADRWGADGRPRARVPEGMDDDVSSFMERERERRPWRQGRRGDDSRDGHRDDRRSHDDWDTDRANTRNNGYGAASSRDGTSRSCTENTRVTKVLRPRSRSEDRTRDRRNADLRPEPASASRNGTANTRPEEVPRRPRLIDNPPEDLPLREAVLLWSEVLDNPTWI